MKKTISTLNHLEITLNGDLELSLFCRGEFLRNLNPNGEWVRVDTNIDISEDADIGVTHAPHLRRFRVDVIANPESAYPETRGHRDVKFITY